MGVACNLLMLTTARTRMADPWSYCNATIAALEGQNLSGLGMIGIVSDGPYGGTRPDGWIVREHEKQAQPGNALAFWRLLMLGAELGGDLIAIEDDVVFAADAVARITELSVPSGAGWVQFFRPPRYRSPMLGPGLWPKRRGSHLFNQSLKFSAAAVRALATYKPRAGIAGADSALALAGLDLGIDYHRHVPDLVQHVGAISQFHANIDSIHGRTAESFPAGAAG